jgi:glutathione peroxidase
MRALMAALAGIGLFGGMGAVAGEPGAYVLDHKMVTIDGKEVKLEDYKGKVLLFVNVASKCGLTKQYEQLVELHDRYKDKGLVILGFPANNFGAQEPGTNEEIQEFCSTKYNVEFPMFSKISVKGDDIHPLYKELTSEEENKTYSGEIKWNFTKFLVDREGKVVARFEPRVEPTADTVINAIEDHLEEQQKA